jgi:hypothetical protein
MTVLKNLLADLEVPDDQVYVPQPTMPGLPVEPGWRLVRGDQPASVALVGLSTVDAVSEAVGQVAAEIGSGTAVLVVDRQVGELPTGRMLTALAEHDLLVTQMVELTNARVGVAMVLTRDRSQAPLSPAFGEPVDLLTAGDRLRNEWLVEGFRRPGRHVPGGHRRQRGAPAVRARTEGGCDPDRRARGGTGA